MPCPICGAKCVCRKRGEDGRCCPCHKHKSRTPAQALAHAEDDRRRATAAAAYPIEELLAELQPLHVDRRDGFTYPGLFERPVITDLVILSDPKRAGLRTVVIATERGDNPGASITNTIEKLAAALSSETGMLLGDFVLIEHYPADRYGAPKGELPRSLDRVDFERMWSGPTWTHLSIEALTALVHGEVQGVGV